MAILSVNRQIRIEAGKVYYRVSNFEIHIASNSENALDTFAAAVPREFMARLSVLEVDFLYGDPEHYCKMFEAVASLLQEEFTGLRSVLFNVNAWVISGQITTATALTLKFTRTL